MDKGVHEGHRQRLRERFRKDGLDSFATHEVVELLLCYARARGDVNRMAHNLLDRFGSFRGLLEAGAEQLMNVPGVGEETATLLALIVPMFRTYQSSICETGMFLGSRVLAERYCCSLLDGHKTERLYVISLSAAAQVLGRRLVSEGSLNEVPAYPRNVVEAALNHNAMGAILCHNHPGGVAEPSNADLDMTLSMEKVLGNLGIHLVDHIIVAAGNAYSMSLNGLLKHSAVRQKIDGMKCCEDEQVYIWQN